MLTHADFHLVVSQFKDGLAGGRMGGGAHRDGEGGHVVVEALGDGEHVVKALALFGGGADDFIKRYAADQAAPVFGGSVGAGGYVLVGGDGFNI